MKKVYLSGKYSSSTQQGILDNISHALHHAVIVAKAGVHPIVPHTSFPGAATYGAVMQVCRAQLLDCHAIYLIPGWEDSPGAVQERDWAVSVGMPVLNSIHEVQAWARSAA